MNSYPQVIHDLSTGFTQFIRLISMKISVMCTHDDKNPSAMLRFLESGSKILWRGLTEWR